MINEFISWERDVKRLQPRTIEEYEKDLRAFARWASPQGLSWSTLSQSDIERYAADMTTNGSSAATVKRSISVIRQLTTWAYHHEILKNNAGQYVSSPKLRQRLPEVADRAMIDKFLAKKSNSQEVKIAQAVVAIAADTGMRLQEIIDLKREDFNGENHSIKVTGKGGKQRVVYYTNRIIPYVMAVYGKRDTHIIPTENQRTIRTYIYRHCGSTHPHAIRHLFASELLNNGAELMTIKTLLGHKSVTTTERYTHLGTARVEEQYRQLHTA